MKRPQVWMNDYRSTAKVDLKKLKKCLRAARLFDPDAHILLTERKGRATVLYVYFQAIPRELDDNFHEFQKPGEYYPDLYVNEGGLRQDWRHYREADEDLVGENTKCDFRLGVQYFFSPVDHE